MTPKKIYIYLEVFFVSVLSLLLSELLYLLLLIFFLKEYF